MSLSVDIHIDFNASRKPRYDHSDGGVSVKYELTGPHLKFIINFKYTTAKNKEMSFTLPKYFFDIIDNTDM